MTNERESFRTAGGRPPKMTKAQESRVEAASKRIAGRTGAGAGGDRTPSGHSGEGGAISGALAAIQERANAATPGPWEHARDSNEHLADCPPTYESLVTADNGYVAVLDWGNISTSPDAEFIAHARTDVPRLASALQAVVEVHAEGEIACPNTHHRCGDPDFQGARCPDTESACEGCGESWPCPTIRTIEQAKEAGA